MVSLIAGLEKQVHVVIWRGLKIVGTIVLTAWNSNLMYFNMCNNAKNMVFQQSRYIAMSVIVYQVAVHVHLLFHPIEIQ